MIGTTISPFRNTGGRDYFSADALALFARWDALGVSASASYKTIANNIINALKTSGDWNNLDSFQVYCFHDRTASLVDWKRPAVSAVTTNDYAGDWTINTGIKGNGTNFRLDTSFNPYDGGTYNYTQNNNTQGVYCSTHLDTGTVSLMSVRDGSDAGVSITINGLFLQGSNNNSTSVNISKSSNVGLWSNTRTSSTAYMFEKDGRDENFIGGAKGTAVSSVSVNRTIKLLCKDLNGTYSTYCKERIAYFFAGNSSVSRNNIADVMYKYCFLPLSNNVVNNTQIIYVGDSFETYNSYQPRVSANITNTYAHAFHNRSQNGYNTSQLYTDSLTNVFPYYKSYFTKNIIFLHEMVNSMTQYNSDVTSVVNDVISYCNYARSLGFKVIVTTMCSHKETAAFLNAASPPFARLTVGSLPCR